MVEVLIEGRRLDVFEGFDFSFNYSIADVREPAKRSTEYTKTIKCPSTPNNDLLFGHVYDVNISNPFNSGSTNIEVNFNPNKKAECRVISDGVEVMGGVVQLREINIVNTKTEYDVVFIGNLMSFFSVIGKKKIKELIDFSYLDHEYSSANVQASWAGTLGYTYPMIDYGDDFDSALGVKNWVVRQFRPAMFAKFLLDKIFEAAGFSYTSNFITSSPFENLIIPFDGEKIYADNSVFNLRKFQASLSSAEGPFVTGDFFAISQNVLSSVIHLDNDSTGGNFDAGNHWSTSAFRYLVPSDGFYGFGIKQSIRLVRTTFTPTRSYNGNVTIQLQIVKTDVNLNTTVIAEGSQAFQIANNPATFDQTLDITTNCEEQVMRANDKIQFRFIVNFSEFTTSNLSGQQIVNTNMFTDFEMTTETSTGTCTPSNVIFEGDTMVMNSVAPDVTAVDLIMSWVRMFNLYILTDPLNEQNIIIQTRDEYYAGGTIRDWSKKLARNKDIAIKPMGLLSAKIYNYQYNEDSDYYNARYMTSHDRTYGSRRYEVDNDFLNDTKEVDVIFSATPMQIEGETNRFVARIYDEDISEGAKPTSANIRILYYRYLPCNIWSLVSEVTGGTTTILSNYPYAGHLDHPITPTLDLCFGIPLELFYQANASTGTLQYTNANLYNVYHRKHIAEITDKDAKMLTGMFYLDQWDISKLNFRDQILIDNCYWRLNKVMNYNPFKDDLSKVELFKVLDLIPSKVETFRLGEIGSTGSGEITELMPNMPRQSKQLSNYNSYNGSVNGQRNSVSPNAQGFRILGNDNYIGDSTRNVSIVGNGNYVAGGLNNVIILNSDNQQVYQSNVSVIDGQFTYPISVIDGGFDIALDPNDQSLIRVVDGGFNIVQAINTTTLTNLING